MRSIRKVAVSRFRTGRWPPRRCAFTWLGAAEEVATCLLQGGRETQHGTSTWDPTLHIRAHRRGSAAMSFPAGCGL